MERDLFAAIGGSDGCRGLATALYRHVAVEPVLRPFFPGKSFRCATEEFSAFLVQFLGGPSGDTQFRWWVSLQESHSRFRIDATEREAWLRCMQEALKEVPIDDGLREDLSGFFKRSSAYLVNSGSQPSESEPVSDLAWHWQTQVDLDELVAAIRAGDATSVVSKLEHDSLKRRFRENRSLLAHVLATMIAGANDTLVNVTRHKLTEDPDLAHEKFNGRTLLHTASSRGNSALVEFLLRLGANANELDGGSHAPLYSVANECRIEGGDVVRLLIAAGAVVNANGGAKRCTALHMAARRNSAEIAEALIECGADIEAKDSAGETALRRAVNCSSVEVAGVLVMWGANRFSVGSKGLTPIQAAKTEEMRAILVP